MLRVTRVALHNVRVTSIESIPEDSERGWVPSVLDDFGARLALVRHHKGWNIKEAALACGVPPASWRGWELDGLSPRNFLTVVNKISRGSGCDVIWLSGFPVTAARDEAAWADPLSADLSKQKSWAPRGSNPQPTDYEDAGSARIIPFRRAA
jgi:hypothetical protein